MVKTTVANLLFNSLIFKVMKKLKKMNLDALAKDGLLDSELNALKGGWNGVPENSIGNEMCESACQHSCLSGCSQRKA